MKINTQPSLAERLRKAGIRHFDELIHDQDEEWLIKNFPERKGEYPVNVTRLMRNLLWQMKERIASEEKPPFKELILSQSRTRTSYHGEVECV